MSGASEQEMRATSDAALRHMRKRNGAAPATVEALVYELRVLGLAALAGRNCKQRLAEVSDEQLKQIIERLGRLRTGYPAITEGLLDGLKGLLS